MGFSNKELLRADWQWVGLQNYVTLFKDEHFLSALGNTFVFVVGTVPITTILALGMALLVNRKFRGRGIFRAGYFFPSITSMVVIALIFQELYRRDGYVAMLATMIGLTPPEYGFLIDKSTALYSIMAMDIWMSVGYYMLIFLAGLKSIPDELYEAARMQGASFFHQLRYITIPILRPVALFIIVINSIKSFQVFVEIYVMTGGKSDTMSMVYFVYENGVTKAFQFGYASAAAIILFAIIGVFSIMQFSILKRREPIW